TNAAACSSHRVEAAEAACIVEAGYADVDGAPCERGLYPRGRQRRIAIEKECSDACRMRRGRRCAEERAEGRAGRNPAGVRDRDAVERDEIGLGANLQRGEIDASGSVRAERLDIVEAGIVYVDGADGDHGRQRRMPEDAAGGGAVLERRRAQAEELEAARRSRESIDPDGGTLVRVALVHARYALDRILCALLRVDALGDEPQVGVEEGEVVIVRRPAERIVPLQDAGERSSCGHDDSIEPIARAGGPVVDLS